MADQAAGHSATRGNADAANARAIARIAATAPVLREPVTAREALGLADGELGHADRPSPPARCLHP
jgi:hypothetical protein